MDYIEQHFGSYIEIIKNPVYENGDVLHLDVGDFVVQKLLGEGAEGYIYEVGSLSAPGESFALKLPQLGTRGTITEELAGQYVKSVKLLRTLKHENIISVNPRSRFMLMEKADGTLSSLRGVTTEPASSFFLQKAGLDVTAGMEKLYAEGIYHSELFTHNVVYVETEDSVTFKIIDIGFTHEEPRLLADLKYFAEDLEKLFNVSKYDEFLKSVEKATDLGELKQAFTLNPGATQKPLSAELQLRRAEAANSGGPLDDTLSTPSRSSGC